MLILQALLFALPSLALPGFPITAGRQVQVPLNVPPVPIAPPPPHTHNSPSAAAAGTTPEPERYAGHKVLRIDLSRHIPDAMRAELMGIFETFGLDLWRVSRRSIDVHVPASITSVVPGYVRALCGSHCSVSTFVPDVQALIDAAPVSAVPEGGWNVSSLDSPFHDGYHVLDDVYSFGDALQEAFGDMISSFDLGKTAEGRPMRAWSAKMREPEPVPEPGPGDGNDGNQTTTSSKNGKKRTQRNWEDLNLEIIIQAGQHAREWVSTSAAFYFLHSLLVDAAADPEGHAAGLLKVFTFTVVPVVNPDGFAYSHEHSRLWKKNRQNVGGLLCKGIDLNGNWGYQFAPSRLACSDSYKGTTAFEAYETRAMSHYIVNGTVAEGELREKKVKAFIDLHSYGQLFMFPFAYSCADFPPDAENLMEAGLGVAKAMRQTHEGEGYECGQACDLTYRSTGDAIDYTYGVGDVRWSYSAELRDTGTYGFVLPPHLIRPTGAEVTAGIRYLASFIFETEIDK